MENHCLVLIKDNITELTFEKIFLAVKNINYFELRNSKQGELLESFNINNKI